MADRRGFPPEYLISAERVCLRCGGTFPREEFARDASKTFGFKSWCKECERKRGRAYYAANRERILEAAVRKRGRPRSPERTECSECGEPLEVRQRVCCGSSKCREQRFRRLQPEAYAAREAAKVERRREARRRARKAGA